jgi:hypothetical protein
VEETIDELVLKVVVAVVLEKLVVEVMNEELGVAELSDNKEFSDELVEIEFDDAKVDGEIELGDGWFCVVFKDEVGTLIVELEITGPEEDFFDTVEILEVDAFLDKLASDEPLEIEFSEKREVVDG